MKSGRFGNRFLSVGWSPGRALAMAWVLGALGAAVPSVAHAQIEMKLGRVKGPSWSRVRAAIQVSLTARQEVQMVRKGGVGRVGGQVRKGGRGLVADLAVRDSEGRPKGRARFSGVDGRDLARDIKERLWSALGGEILSLEAEPAVAQAVPPPRRLRIARPRPSSTREDRDLAQGEPERAPEPVAELESSSEERPSRPAQGLAGEALRFELGAGIFSRDLGWVDDLFDELAGYSLGGAPAFRMAAEWFPGAHFTQGPASWVGLEVDAELPFAVESDREGESFPTAASAWRVGLLARYPLDFLEASLGFGFAERRFSIEASEEGSAIPDFPEVRYQTLGLRARIAFRLEDRIDLALRGGWGFMLDSGAIGRANWFPNSESHTASVGARVGYQLGQGLGLFARFDWQGAFFDLRPEPGDARVAGGATDNFYLGTAGVSFSAQGG